jgi:hypothetical protein
MISQIPAQLILMSQESPDARLYNLFYQLTINLNYLIGCAEFLDYSLHEQSNPPEELLIFQEEAARIGQELNKIRILYLETRSSHREDDHYIETKEDIFRWRKKLLPLAKELMDLVVQMESNKGEMAKVLHDDIELIDLAINIANRIWITIDVLTNPDFRTPTEKSD